MVTASTAAADIMAAVAMRATVAAAMLAGSEEVARITVPPAEGSMALPDSTAEAAVGSTAVVAASMAEAADTANS
jgi:hypothetical protein